MYSKQQLHNFRRHFFKETNIRPFIRISRGESIHTFHTIHECAMFFNVDPEDVWEAFVHKTLIQDYAVSNINCADKIAVEYKLKKHITRDLASTKTALTHRPIKVIDIKDDEVAQFSSVSRAARRLRVSVANIRHRISTKDKHSLIAGRFIVVDADTNIDFITKEVKDKLLNRLPRQIVLYKHKEGKLFRYTGLADFVREEDCQENSVHIYYALKTYGIYLFMPNEYIMFDPKRGGKTPDKEMFKYFQTKLNALKKFDFNTTTA